MCPHLCRAPTHQLAQNLEAAELNPKKKITFWNWPKDLALENRSIPLKPIGRIFSDNT
jgi:hypothetical protein